MLLVSQLHQNCFQADDMPPGPSHPAGSQHISFLGVTRRSLIGPNPAAGHLPQGRSRHLHLATGHVSLGEEPARQGWAGVRAGVAAEGQTAALLSKSGSISLMGRDPRGESLGEGPVDLEFLEFLGLLFKLGNQQMPQPPADSANATGPSFLTQQRLGSPCLGPHLSTHHSSSWPGQVLSLSCSPTPQVPSRHEPPDR